MTIFIKTLKICFSSVFVTVINSTYPFGSDDIGSDKKASDTEDVLYQRDASFSAKLDGFPTSDDAITSDLKREDDDTPLVISNDITDHSHEWPKDSLLRTKPKLTVRWVENTTPVTAPTLSSTNSAFSTVESTTTTQTQQQSYNVAAGETNGNYYPAFKEDMSIYDDVNNNRLNLRSPSEMYQMLGTVLREDQQQQHQQQKHEKTPSSLMMDSTTSPFPSSSGPDSTSHSYIQIDVFDNGEAERLFVGAARETITARPSTQPEAISKTEASDAVPTTVASTVEQLSTTTR